MNLSRSKKHTSTEDGGGELSGETGIPKAEYGTKCHRAQRWGCAAGFLFGCLIVILPVVVLSGLANVGWGSFGWLVWGAVLAITICCSDKAWQGPCPHCASRQRVLAFRPVHRCSGCHRYFVMRDTRFLPWEGEGQ